MLEHQYGVQGLLYAVAVCRFFRTATEGFDIERNFGGLHYLFLRGMCAGTARGVFSFRPPTATIVALDTALGGSP
jgi:exodeoxyribonuclease V beta subunit